VGAVTTSAPAARKRRKGRRARSGR
jgi:hypothetical protein